MRRGLRGVARHGLGRVKARVRLTSRARGRDGARVGVKARVAVGLGLGFGLGLGLGVARHDLSLQRVAREQGLTRARVRVG